MKDNRCFNASKAKKNDEFYTLYEDIEKELVYYAGYFNGRSVYLNCDNPECSCFFKYFCRNFHKLCMKKLTATYYMPAGDTYKAEYDGNTCRREKLSGNGDFRSPECMEILESCDVAVTNPPFSMFREYMQQVQECRKDFLVIGNMNAVAYKTLFPLLMDGAVWTGHTLPSRFMLPGGAVVPYGSAVWYTNIGGIVRHNMPALVHRYYGGKDIYIRYDNYDAINTDKVSDIPCDYYGVIGVPVSYIKCHDPGMFRIAGYTGGTGFDMLCGVHTTKTYEGCVQHCADGRVVNGSKLNTGAVVKYESVPDGTYYTASNSTGYLVKKYGRILIQRV